MVATEIITAGGGVAAAAIGYLAVRHTGRQAVIVSHDDVQRRRDVVESWETFTTSLQNRGDAQDKKIAAQDVKIDGLVDKLAEVSRKMDRAGRTLTAAIAYIERLLDFISAQLPNHPNVPPMPAEVRQQMHEH